ncbi:MAG: hypothetical protein NC122_10445 [Faecalibacterium sp.]|nr:hypothetical protein [Ruminococcus sp.]MCM1392949.1 hypothetical protein [Ruminococcus sp.]MCM1486609.1 hypothetical protein [Faecalibacterium sp.]
MSKKENIAVSEAVSDEKFTAKHQTLWQFIKFLIFSQFAGLVEIVSFAILSNVLPEKLPNDFDVFVFHYTNDKGLCLGAFVAFFVSAVLAEIVSFLINRKATFNANNNVVKSAIEYAVLILVVICLKTWIVTVLTPVVEGFTSMNLLIEWIPKLASMVIAFAIIFPMNKFVIMKHTEKEEA